MIDYNHSLNILNVVLFIFFALLCIQYFHRLKIPSLREAQRKHKISPKGGVKTFYPWKMIKLIK